MSLVFTASLLYADGLFKEIVVTCAVTRSVTSNLSVYLQLVSLWSNLILYQMFGWNFILEQWQSRCWNRFHTLTPYIIYLIGVVFYVMFFPITGLCLYWIFILKSYFNLGFSGFFFFQIYSCIGCSCPSVPSFYQNTQCVGKILSTNWKGKKWGFMFYCLIFLL